MKRMLWLAAAMLAGMWGASGAEYVDSGVSVDRCTDKLVPVYMHGKITGIRGCLLIDSPRSAFAEKSGRYVSGEECFKLDVDPEGVATLSFPSPIPAPYANNPRDALRLGFCIEPGPPAPAYHITGRVKLDKGVFRFAPGRKFLPKPGWQKVDYYGPLCAVLITPAAGANISFADLKAVPAYPAAGGTIALPDGGSLTRLLLPANADPVMRWSVAMWQGWLWKLTGVALPVETVPEVKPTPGAFAAIPDPGLERGWVLQVNKEGITLRYSENDDIVPALFDYMRLKLGFAYYASDCVKMPKLPVEALPEIDRRAKPRYKGMLASSPQLLYSGGKTGLARYIRNDVDYYHSNKSAEWIHILDITMPQELYFAEHPEYFYTTPSGDHAVASNSSFTQQCMTNPEACDIMLGGLKNLVKAQQGLHLLCFEPGDTPNGCLCPRCSAYRKNVGTDTDMQMEFTNRAIRELRKIDPKLRVFRCAYFNRRFPPRNVRVGDGIDIFYCVTDHLMPCTLHADCSRNRECVRMLEEWNRALGGDSSRLGFMTYDDARPLQMMRMAEYFNRFASGDFYMFQFHYTPLALRFVMPRWNLGEDPDKLMEEFDLNYFGKAGKIMHELTLFIDDYGRNYRHHGNEGKLTNLFCGSPGHSKTAFTREALDKIYTFFDRAVAAAGDDKVLRARIFEEKKYVMVEDFLRYGPRSCATEEELKAFVARLVDFIRMAREAPGRFNGIVRGGDIRKVILTATGLGLTDSGKFWANEPVIDKFLADPMSFFSGADRIPGGWYFKPLAMQGGVEVISYSYSCPERYCAILRRPGLNAADEGHAYAPGGAGEGDKSTATIALDLDYAPDAPTFLAIEGQDDDKPGRSQLRVTVNGTEIFSGDDRFPELAWGRMGLNVPPGILKKGRNTIAISNVTPDTPSRSVRFSDPGEAAKDQQWGWIAVSEVYWLEVSRDFDRFVNGDQGTQWCFHSGDSRASADVGEGRARLSGGAHGPAYLNLGHRTPKVAVTPGDRVEVAVTASGKGKLYLGMWSYMPYRKGGFSPAGYCGEKTKILRHSKSRAFELAPEPQEFKYVFTPPKGTGFVIPRIYSEEGTRAEVTRFRMRLLPPEK